MPFNTTTRTQTPVAGDSLPWRANEAIARAASVSATVAILVVVSLQDVCVRSLTIHKCC